MILLLTSLVLSGTVPVLAQGPATEGEPERYIEKLEDWRKRQERRITFADRQAAAKRAAAAGFMPPQIGAAQMAMPGAAPHYFSHPNYANSPLPSFIPPPAVPFSGTFKVYFPIIYSVPVTYTGGIRKFVDGLPGLTSAGANNLGQYIPVAVPDKSAYPGSDYYEIALVEYQEQMHSDLPPTTLRGYVQLNGGTGTPHYLGPAIIAEKDVPVRIKFYNQLPTGVDGNLFLPVDTTVMGSGPGPDMMMGPEPDPQNPMCGDYPNKPAECYTENRATIHLHGGISPWISDGTPHQWITPANENTPYPQGVSVRPVPDMDDTGDPTDGIMTFYYTNQQSARLMFYHDHAWGITRLNVYAGEAAPYLIRDDVERSLVSRGLIPADEIPLVIQDKTFVPEELQLAAQDETWDMARWGGAGSLWLPHVYSPAQNPGDSSGVNQYGRWAYGPWFWPPTNVPYGPVANPYYDPNCDPDLTWCEPPLMPGTPYNSMGMEAFMDTPVVNGTAYPTLTVDPKSYRFRILNAANDRFFNLSFYQAIDAKGVKCDRNNPNPAVEITGVACTEVALNPAEVAAALNDPAGVFPTPVEGTEGPNWIQIGTEGGFLPAPVKIAPQPITWVTDPTVFNAGNVDQHSLLLAPAERADVIVDFSQYAGQTLMLYNDAPAAFPARDPRYDYYTGNANLWDTGGAPSTLPGYGPNTRTVMQIKVRNTSPAPAFNLGALQAAFAHQADGSGVFESGQNPIIVGQGAYNSAYGTAFQNNGPNAGLVQIFNTSFSFKTLSEGAAGPSLTFPLQPKMIQDEMGEAFDPEYGRMSGMLGVETPNAQAGQQNMILYPYTYPSPDILKGVEVTGTVNSLVVTPIATIDDGTQIWKITHNGVDTHPIHWHLYDAQLINRVGWDGIIRKPDDNELGWKDTIRISPLEDTIVAIRPIVPHYPFELPNSIRLLDPSMPAGHLINDIPAFNPYGEPITIYNHEVNFGLEHVWHCHILSHEEMDMMHAVSFAIAPSAPISLEVTYNGNEATLTWEDTSLNETHWKIQRAENIDGPWTALVTIPSTTGPAKGTVTYIDTTATQPSFYHVLANNLVGDTEEYNPIRPGPDFPTFSLDSAVTVAGQSVIDWNATAQQIIQPAPMSPVSMSAAFVYLSYVQGAVYNALVAIEGRYAPYHSTLTADPSASPEAAVAAAAYNVLVNYFPNDPEKTILDGKYAAALAAIPDGPNKDAGILVGQQAAAEMIALRSGDVLSGDGGYIVPAPGPGIWEPTMMAPPMDPWMAVLTPFLRASPSGFRPGPPLALSSAEYATDFNEVKNIGGAMSMTRTPAQAEAAQFWTTNMVIQTNNAYRKIAATRGLSLLATARLMAMGNMVAADSLIANFDSKYFYNFWRPVTAIRKADTDGNAATAVDPTWMPLVMTPNFPEYIAGHPTFLSAQAEVYTHFLGAQIEIDLESSATGTTRHYATAANLRQEIVDARTWGGLHFRSSSVLAVDVGQQLATNAIANYFTPVP